MYKLSAFSTCVTRLRDGAVFEPDAISPESKEYLNWLSQGNTPLPADPLTPEQLFAAIEHAIKQHMDTVAQSKRYDNRDSCRLYAGYPNPYQAEAVAYGQWVAECWRVSNIAQADIIAGLRSIPTPAEAVLELSAMVWPVLNL
jgi:hypothetical protein